MSYVRTRTRIQHKVVCRKTKIVQATPIIMKDYTIVIVNRIVCIRCKYINANKEQIRTLDETCYRVFENLAIYKWQTA